MLNRGGKGVPLNVLAQDVTVAAGVPIHVGMLSQFGLTVLFGAATTALTGAAGAYAAARPADPLAGGPVSLRPGRHILRRVRLD